MATHFNRYEMPDVLSASLKVGVQKLSSLTPFSIIKATGLHQSFDSLCLEPSGAGMCQNDVVPAALKYWFGALLCRFIVFLYRHVCYMCKRCVSVCACIFVHQTFRVCVCLCNCVCAAAKLPAGTSVS